MKSTSLSMADSDAVIFDLDGVVTETANVHAAAWKEMFDAYLQVRADREGVEFRPFDQEEEYQRYVDGKPRYDGVKSFLESRGIELPYGAPDDPPERETVCGLGNRKNRLFRKHLEEEGVDVYEASVALVKTLRAEGKRVAVISSSKNCRAVLEAVGITGLFDVIVDGIVSEQLGLDGKPAPDIFLEAARRLGIGPERCVVVEDALSGVEAGSRGGFALVVGVDRSGQADRLREHGADVVVGDLSELRMWEGGEEARTMTDALPSALNAADRIERSLEGRKPVVFLDYDGTLTPIVQRPDDAVLSEPMRQAVGRLADLCTVAVVSGRDMKDVRGRVGLDTVIYAGSHGFEISGPGGLAMENEEAAEYLPDLKKLDSFLRRNLADIAGVKAERKKFAVALHYRQVDSGRVPEVEQAAEQASQRFDRLRMSRGKKIFEFQPDIDWNKGRAVLWLIEALRLNSDTTVPFYLGDDTTDEDAFRVLQDRGIGIVVERKRRPTAARFILADPGEVERFLEKMRGWVKV